MNENAKLRAVEPEAAAEPGSFADRVASRRVDLVKRLRDGIPPVDYLPGSSEIIRRGKRHHAVAPKKVGKSIGTLVLAVDIALAGDRVVIFDRENGADLYAYRLGQIVAARKLDELEQAALGGLIAYYEFPRFRGTDQVALAALCARAGLVVFDSQRMYLSDLGLEENSSDDYAAFMASLVDPLFQARIATLILDNSGHQDPSRGRGASAKGDLNEILFAFDTVDHFDLDTVGRLRLEITDSRFGDSGRWEIKIGGGTFGSWDRVDQPDRGDNTGFRPTGLMERASIFLEGCPRPVVRREITDAISGKTQYKRVAVDVLVREGFARGAKGSGVESVKPYREAEDPRAKTGRNP